MTTQHNLKNFDAKAEYDKISNPLEMRAWLDLVLAQLEEEHNRDVHAPFEYKRKHPELAISFASCSEKSQAASERFLMMAKDLFQFRVDYEFDAGDQRILGRVFPSSPELFVDDLKDIKNVMAPSKVLAFSRR